MQNGVWLLPDRPEQARFLLELLDTIERQSASGQIFYAQAFDPGIEQDILERFRSVRDEEYAEFCERSQDLLNEIDKETAKNKFTFAELEDIEEDRKKLEQWLGKIQARDFFGGLRAPEAAAMIQTVREAYQIFSKKVYASQGVGSTDEGTSDSGFHEF